MATLLDYVAAFGLRAQDQQKGLYYLLFAQSG
jgi:hypothetical protein